MEFRTGYYPFNENEAMNFQLNRFYSCGTLGYDELMEVGKQATDFETWISLFTELAEKAEAEENHLKAAVCYRAAQFYTLSDKKDKQGNSLKKVLYEKCMEHYDAHYGSIEGMHYERIPYETGYLPVYYMKPEGSKGIIVLHGGYDSFIQEFLDFLPYFASKGYETYFFEGPGQGGVMRIQGKHFTHEWEKPVKVILDYFKLSDVTIIGISLGGYLAPRAAAFDKRITKVVAWSIFPCFQDILVSMQPQGTQRAFHILMKLHARPLLNLVFGKKAKKSPIIDWGIKHGCYAYEAKDAYSYAKKLKLYDIAPVADQITQDMLILGASGDHFIDYHLIGKEINMLRNVRSLTFRLFTDKEEAENHCNVGNGKLAIDEILSWITRIGSKE